MICVILKVFKKFFEKQESEVNFILGDTEIMMKARF